MSVDKDLFKDLLDLSDDDDDGDEDESNTESGTEDGKDNDELTEEEKKKKEEEEKKKKEEEEKRQKNKDAEEARKRREREEKEKEKSEKEKEQVNELGRQIVECKKKYPDMVIEDLDKDANFKKFIEGKLLGKKDFTVLYEDYISLRSSLSGKTDEEIREDYEKKKNASGGSFVQPIGKGTSPEIYSENELEKISARLPFMPASEANKVMEKFDKSIAFYKKQKK